MDLADSLFCFLASMIDQYGHPQSPLVAEGKCLSSGLFGSSESTVVNAVSNRRQRYDAASTLMAMATPLALAFLGRRVRSG
jgi:hypothetical protein